MEVSDLAKLDVDLLALAATHRTERGTVDPAEVAAVAKARLGETHPLVQSAAAAFIRERARSILGV